MSTKDPNPNPGVDPSERNEGITGQQRDGEKEKDKGGNDKDAPTASSKGINPVQHSE